MPVARFLASTTFARQLGRLQFLGLNYASFYVYGWGLYSIFVIKIQWQRDISKNCKANSFVIFLGCNCTRQFAQIRYSSAQILFKHATSNCNRLLDCIANYNEF